MTTIQTPATNRHFDLIDWAVEDSFVRVAARGPHSLTNEVLKAFPAVTWEQAHALAQQAWDGGLPELGSLSVEASWG